LFLPGIIIKRGPPTGDGKPAAEKTSHTQKVKTVSLDGNLDRPWLLEMSKPEDPPKVQHRTNHSMSLDIW
jgi:hypothetical protein